MNNIIRIILFFLITVSLGCRDDENSPSMAGVYAGGYCYNSSGVIVAGYWKNGEWNGLPPLDESRSSAVTSLAIIE